jgi:L-threonylcarbamoyladenylate synthase
MTTLPFKSSADVDSALPTVADHLSRGGLIAYPTETVYGLGSRVQVEDLAALAAVTKRPDGKPFLVLVSGEAMIRNCGLVLTVAATRLAARFWPGPLTLVLAVGTSTLPKSLCGHAGGIAVRWSSHPETSRLIQALGIPVSSTSANISGRDPLPDVDAIRAEFAEATESRELLLLDGGTQSGARPSTLVDCTSTQPRVLRDGAVSRSQIVECLEEVCD